MTAVVVICGGSRNGHSVLNQIDVAADRLLDLIPIGSIIAGAADDGRAILKDREEVLGAHSVVLHALHDQCAVGRTAGHVVEVSVDAQHHIVVLHIVCGIRRIRVTLLGRCHLIGYAGHSPALRGIVGVVVGVNTYVLAGNIHGGDIVHDLFFIGGQCIVDRLGHAGCDSRRIRGEHRVVLVVRFGFRIRLGLRGRTNGVGAVGIARKVKEIVCKSIAARLTQRLIVGKVGQRIGALQCADQGIAGIGAQDLAPDSVLGDHAAKTVGQEIGSAACVCKPCGEVVFNDRTQGHVAVIHLCCEIERIHVAKEIRISK